MVGAKYCEKSIIMLTLDANLTTSFLPFNGTDLAYLVVRRDDQSPILFLIYNRSIKVDKRHKMTRKSHAMLLYAFI